MRPSTFVSPPECINLGRLKACTPTFGASTLGASIFGASIFGGFDLRSLDLRHFNLGRFNLRSHRGLGWVCIHFGVTTAATGGGVTEHRVALLPAALASATCFSISAMR